MQRDNALIEFFSAAAFSIIFGQHIRQSAISVSNHVVGSQCLFLFICHSRLRKNINGITEIEKPRNNLS